MGFSVAATNDKTDRILGGAIDHLIEEMEVPEGTQDNGLTYGLRLKFNGQTLADIDCFDYRGGAIDDEAESEAGKMLSERIAKSDIILWLIDLSDIPKEQISSGKSRIKTKLRRLNSICSQALEAVEARPRIWSFVRSKVDVNFDELTSENLKEATLELQAHLGGALTISTFDGVPYANLVSIAPIGKVTREGSYVIAGDNIVNVEWPLLISVLMMVKARLATLDEQIEAAARPAPGARGGFFSSPRQIEEDQSNVSSEAEKEREFLSAVDDHVSRNIPSSIIIIQPPNVAGTGGE